MVILKWEIELIGRGRYSQDNRVFRITNRIDGTGLQEKEKRC